MSKLSRRSVVVSAATASAVLGLDRYLAFIPSAHAQKAGSGSGSAAKGSGAGSGSAAAASRPFHNEKVAAKGWHRFKVGDVEITQIYDGIANAPIDASFIPGTTAEQIKAALIKGGLAGDVRPNFFTVTVAKIKGKYVMFDASTGGQLASTAGLMVARNMYAAGIEPAKISAIVVTHFHPDHISGMISKETNSQVYPDAEIIVPAAEYKHWTAPDLVAKLPEGQRPLAQRIQATFPKWKNLRQIEPDKDVLPGIRSVATYGHTPGHTSYLISAGKQQLMVLGDVTNIPAINVANPDWSIMFDADKPLAAAVRRKVFDRAIADKLMLTGYHWGMPGAGTVKKDGNGYAFIPVG
jgi:glyoxylase-like metal-dependent hydrolase (beta-lactamase superfamily II)